MPPWPCTMPLGSPVVPGGVEHPQRVVERHRRRTPAAPRLGGELGPRHACRRASPPGPGSGTSTVARSGRAAARAARSTVGADVEALAAVAGSRRRRAAPTGSIWANRSCTARAPKSGEHDDQIAPRLGRGEERDERLDAVRGERDDPVARARRRPPPARPGRGPTRSRSSAWVTRALAARPRGRTRRATSPSARPGPGGERVLGVVQRRAGEPLRARHLASSPASRVGGVVEDAPREYSATADQNPSRSATDQSCSCA